MPGTVNQLHRGTKVNAEGGAVQRAFLGLLLRGLQRTGMVEWEAGEE